MDNSKRPVVMHTDGGARGNPGPGALGVVIDMGARGIKEYGKYLGVRTNNEAEYAAVIFALKKLKALLGSHHASTTEVVVNVDSELVAKQLSGEYRIKEQELYAPFVAVWNAQHDFRSVMFRAVPRHENRQADAIVNRVLDAQQQ